MYKFNNRHLFVLILICILAFIIPFFTKTNNESLNTVLQTSFTIIGALVSLITLIVAVILFDRFGVNAKFKEKQLDVVLTLINELKILSFTVSNGKLTYLNYIRQCVNLEQFPSNTFDLDKRKTLLIPSNFEELIRPIYRLHQSSWLPIEIKEKLNFMYFNALNEVDLNNYSKYVKLNVDEKGEAPWLITHPTYTFEEFSINLSLLLTTTLSWINQHSTIEVDFDLIEII